MFQEFWNWDEFGNFLLQEDLYYPHTWIQMLLWDSLYTFAEPLLSRWPFNKLREKALRITMDHIHYEDECSRYISMAVVEKVNLIGCGNLEVFICDAMPI